MNVLVACEESQVVCKAFRDFGHNAFSCDIQSCSGGHPEWHIRGDVIYVLEPRYDFYLNTSNIQFFTQDFEFHTVPEWDLIIAHPPCTYLSKAGGTRLFPGGHLNDDRYYKGLLAKDFFMRFYNCSCKMVAIENPVPFKIFDLPKPSQVIEPYFFGYKFQKKTYLWLKNLPPLFSTDISYDNKLWVSAGCCNRKNIGVTVSQKLRSKTFPGIAKAMAEQWGCLDE